MGLLKIANTSFNVLKDKIEPTDSTLVKYIETYFLQTEEFFISGKKPVSAISLI